MLFPVLASSSALDAGSRTDVLGAAITVLLGAGGVVFWIFSKRARARSGLRRLPRAGVRADDRHQYLDRKHADPMTAHLFRVYRSWFEHHWKHGTKLCAS